MFLQKQIGGRSDTPWDQMLPDIYE